MLAVIKTGGKQYVVSEGTKLKVETLRQAQGEEVIFDQVLLLVKEGAASAKASASQVEIGTPLVEGAKVAGKVLLQGKAKKVIALRYKAKKRVHVKKGHRQQFTEVEITKI